MELNDSVGFRFHPTEQEIISYFIETKMCYPAWPCRTIREVKNICKFEPWILPKHSPLPSNDQVWYFFNVPVSMSPNSTRIDRTTIVGFWKLTGKDRPIKDKQGKKEIGYKRNLVFHRGRSPKGVGTNWVMHEYHSNKVSPDKEEYVIFRLKRKSGDSSDTYDEPSDHLASDSTNQVAASQVSNFFSQPLSSIQLEQQGTSSSNGLDRNTLSALFSSVQSEQGTSYSNGANRNPLSEIFSSIQQSEQRTSYSNGMDRTPLSALVSLTQSEQRTSNSNGAYRNPLSELLTSIQQSEQRTSDSNGTDRNSISPFFSSIQQEQGTSISIGFNDDWNLSNPPFNTNEQEDAFLYLSDENEYNGEMHTVLHDANSPKSMGGMYVGHSTDAYADMGVTEEDAFLYLSDEDEYNGEIHTVLDDVNPPKSMRGMYVGDSSDTYEDIVATEEDDFLYLSDKDEFNGEIHSVLQDVNPPKSMRGMCVGDSSDTYADIVITEGGPAFEIPILLNGNASSEEYWEVPMVQASNGTSSSSVGGRYRRDDGIYWEVNKQFELQSRNSDTEMCEINSLYEWQMGEFPPSPRTCKAQHMPKSHRVIQEKCATERFQLRGMVSSKLESNDEAREAATSVIDLPRKENNTDKFHKEEKMAQSTNAKTSLKIGSNESEGSNNRKGSTPPPRHKTIPPFVYIGNMLVSFVLILFFIREMILFTR